MLYTLHEAQRAILRPLSTWAEAMSQAYSHPYSPFSYAPFSSRFSAGFELIYRFGKEYQKPDFGVTSVEINGVAVPVTRKVVLEKPFCTLLHFEREFPAEMTDRAPDPVVLAFAPLSGHHSSLLRDTVRTLLRNHDVYLTDWVDARMVPLSEGSFHLDDYVDYAIEFIRSLGPEVHVMSVCQPTVPVLAAVSIMATINDPRQPRSMIMMGGPIDTRQSPTEVNQLAIDKPFQWFERNLIYRVPARYPGAGRAVYPGFLQHAGFIAMNPNRHTESHRDYYEDLVRGDLEDVEAHRRFYDEYNAVLDMPVEYYLDTICTVFQKHLLPLGKWDVTFENKVFRVDPSKINKVALFTIEGELDDISGVGQTQAAHKLCTGIPKSRKRHHTAPGAGHYGIFSGRRWREQIYPEVSSFIRQNLAAAKSRRAA
ncbi:MAG: polyhydroxyalkanoate depolymerase [Burkholderiaceae bacterium]|nr:polyhydroxyalkanoate depolymerase [Burkholderiaceae bacterium]